MKIKITGKKFLHISEDNLLTKGQPENIPIEIPRYYNHMDLKDCIFVIKAVNSDGVYIECPLSVTEYGVQKIYLKWNTSPIITACEGQIGFQLLAQSADKVILYQSFTGYAIVNNGILASDSNNFSTDTLEEYLKNFRKIYNDVKIVGDLVPTNVVTKGEFEEIIKTKADKSQLELLPNKDEIFLKQNAEKILKSKLNKDESAKSALKITGVEDAGLASYYGKDKKGDIGFHKLVVEGTGGTSVDMSLYYDKQQVDNLVNTKPNTETVYKKTQVDSLLNQKVEKNDVYTKKEAESLINKKSDVTDVYNKAFVDEKLDVKADLVGGIVPTEQLPNLGLGEKEKTATGSYFFPSKATNGIVGNKNYAVGEHCKSVGMGCLAYGEACVAVSGNTYGFAGYNKDNKFITVDEAFDEKDLNSIKVGFPVVLYDQTGHSVIATVLEKNTSNIKIDKEPPENCKYIVVPEDGKSLAIATGLNALACGTGAISMGRYTTATSDSATAIGNMSIAKGMGAISLGSCCESQSPFSVSVGYCCTAKGGVAFGNMCDAAANSSTSIGYACSCEGEGSTAIGSSNRGYGKYSFCAGTNNTAMYGQTVVGLGAVPSTAKADVFNATSEAFIVGGSHNIGTPSNVFRVDFNGNAYANAFNNTGADYAECFEWEDKNPNDEDRVGLFITPKLNKVEIATEEDYVIGAVSGNAGVIGNNPMEWQEKYIKDNFGRLIYNKDEKTDEVTLKINPTWDSNRPYIERRKRKEWACIGLLGKIRVMDNGLCKAGEYCTVGKDKGKIGIAVPAKCSSNQKWYVTKRIAKDIIEIIFK